MVAIGFVLLVIPSFIVAVRFYLFGYAMVDKSLGPMASLQESLSITSGHFWQLLLFSVLLLLINVAGILLLGIGLLASVPISTIATAYAYRQLQGEARKDAAILKTE